MVPAPIPKDAKVTPPRRLFTEQPLFPEPRQKEERDAQVVLDTTVGEDGFVRVDKVLSNPGPDFLSAARGAVALWRFEPARVDGCPLPVLMTARVTFRNR